MLCPPALRPGDRVRIVAPSGPFDRTLVWRALGWLASRYRLEYSRRIFERDGYLAGADEARLAELQDAIAAQDVRAVVAARGGYGLGRVVHRLELEPLVRAPKWIVGFSDVTALHLEAASTGVASLHAHNLAGMGRGDAAAREAWVNALEAPDRGAVFEALDVWSPGQAEGPLVGGNLTVLFSAWASGRVAFRPGSVLLLEDVSEAPYRLDRMLTALVVGGALAPVSAVVLGEFTDCPPGKHGVPVEAALRRCLEPLSVPVYAGLPVGHGRRNLPVHLGHVARLRPGGRLEIAPP